MTNRRRPVVDPQSIHVTPDEMRHPLALLMGMRKTAPPTPAPGDHEPDASPSKKGQTGGRGSGKNSRG